MALGTRPPLHLNLVSGGLWLLARNSWLLTRNSWFIKTTTKTTIQLHSINFFIHSPQVTALWPQRRLSIHVRDLVLAIQQFYLP